jgi:hypothetical protein
MDITQYQLALKVAREEGEECAIHLPICNRFGTMVKLFFVVAKVDGEYTERYLKKLKDDIIKLESEYKREKEKWVDREKFLLGQITAKKQVLDGVTTT